MKVYRSQYWYKNKTWFSDYPSFMVNTASSRIAFDIKNFSMNTGMKISHVKCLFDKTLKSGYIDWNKSKWRMVDIGPIESVNELNELVVMS